MTLAQLDALVSVENERVDPATAPQSERGTVSDLRMLASLGG